MSVKEREQEFREVFAMFPEWPDRYEYLISLGQELPRIPDERKNEETKVEGCQSASWLEAEMKDGRLYFKGDSEAVLGKGVITLLLQIVNGGTPEEIAGYDFALIDEIELPQHLSPTRRMGLASVIKRIKTLAKKFKDNE